MHVLDAGLDPVFGVDTHHEAGLVVQFVIAARHLDRHLEVAGNRRIEDVAIVTNKPIVRLAPEIAARIGGHADGVAIDLPGARLIQPLHWMLFSM